MTSSRSQSWKSETLDPYRRRFPERQESFQTGSGMPLEACYFPAEGTPPPDGPGEYPFTRGIHPTMYRGRHWTMRQYAGFSSAAETNRRFHYLLEQGQTGLSVAFDLPTQIGYDGDHPLAAAEVGKVGVAIYSLRDFEALFAGIPLAKVSTSMTINATGLVLFCMYLALAKRQQVPKEKILGTVQNDILKEFIARGNFRFAVEPSMRLTVDLFRFQQEMAPRFNPISVSGYHMREAGCSAVQEVAFTLGDGFAYLQAAQRAGLDVVATARRMSFFFNAHNELFEEIAKFRAARRLWARLLKERMGIEDAKALRLRFHTQTAGSMLTADQPQVNAVRVTLQALAAVLGGTQSLHTNSYDEALGLPTEATARLALRTQQVLAYESGVADVVDPLGGSPFVEGLTDRIEQEALAELQGIEERYGGMVGAVQDGYVQREIHREAMRYQRAVESDQKVVVGVNRFRVEDEEPAEIFKPDPASREQILASLQGVREQRDAVGHGEALEKLAAAAADPQQPLGPPVLQAVEAYATVGEICACLGEAFEPYQAPTII
ncbi:MAG: methylmalonyl-CoA mutase [Planctomycetota bacterium]|nr:MAG: methylmalonyl-CoA mutase [Planctomycetota bacterium]